LIFEDVDSYFNSGLEETGTIKTDSGSLDIDGIYFDGEDIENFMEMDIETDDEIFYVKKSNLPGDQKKGDALNLPNRNNDEDYIIKRFQDEKDGGAAITAIYLSKD